MTVSFDEVLMNSVIVELFTPSLCSLLSFNVTDGIKRVSFSFFKNGVVACATFDCTETKF